MNTKFQVATSFGATFLVAGFLFATGGCGNSPPGGGCESDADCRGDGICVAGTCKLPEEDGTAPNDVGEIAGSDGGDSGAPGTPDTTATPDASSGSSDSEEPHDEPRRDGGRPSEDAYSDGRELSCREMATCGRYLCDQYDYKCKDRFSERTVESEREQRETFNACVQEHCAGTTGQQWVDCLAEECDSDWTTCYTPPDDGRLRCSGFQACIQKCSAADDPQECRIGCQERSTQAAPQRLEDFTTCVQAKCAGLEDRQRLDCVARHCHAELSACYGC